MKTLFGLTLAVAFLSGTLSAFASEDSLVTAVYSSVSKDYQRTKLPDGSYRRETYAISNGGYSPGLARDQSIDRVRFPTIAGVVAQHLAQQNYFLAQDSRSAELLLVISWGKTIPLADGSYRNAQDQALGAMNQVNLTMNAVKMNVDRGLTERSADGIQSSAHASADAAKEALVGDLMQLQMFNSMRDQANEQNARLLGYMKEINQRNDMSRFAGAGTAFDDLITDIESERYYVIIDAYDFRAATQERKQKLQWTTRVSIQAQGNRFDASLMAMLNNASRQFGQGSGHLIRQYQRVPHVELGKLKTMEVVPELEAGSAPPTDK